MSCSMPQYGFLLLLLLAAAAQAQQTAITGKITDSSGGAVGAAKVIATPKGGGPTESTLTNGSGIFSLPRSMRRITWSASKFPVSRRLSAA